MTDGCPWVDLRKWSGLPNVRWCEEQVCSWIATPANTWSNLGYIFVGLLFLWSTQKEKSENIRFYGHASLAVGITSFVYHASLAFATQLLDYLGMFIFFYLVLIQNFARLGMISGEKVKSQIWIWTIVSTGIAGTSNYLGFPIQGLIALIIAVTIITEVMAKKKSKRPIRYRAFFGSMMFFATALTFSVSDVTRKFCDPSDHWIQGHALWHYFGAVALFFSMHHYRQFYSPETGKLDV